MIEPKEPANNDQLIISLENINKTEIKDEAEKTTESSYTSFSDAKLRVFVHQSILSAISPRLAEFIVKAGGDDFPRIILKTSDPFITVDGIKALIEFAYKQPSAHFAQGNRKKGGQVNICEVVLRLLKVYAISDCLEIEKLQYIAYHKLVETMDRILPHADDNEHMLEDTINKLVIPVLTFAFVILGGTPWLQRIRSQKIPPGEGTVKTNDIFEYLASFCTTHFDVLNKYTAFQKLLEKLPILSTKLPQSDSTTKASQTSEKSQLLSAHGQAGSGAVDANMHTKLDKGTGQRPVDKIKYSQTTNQKAQPKPVGSEDNKKEKVKPETDSIPSGNHLSRSGTGDRRKGHRDLLDDSRDRSRARTGHRSRDLLDDRSGDPSRDLFGDRSRGRSRDRSHDRSRRDRSRDRSRRDRSRDRSCEPHGTGSRKSRRSRRNGGQPDRYVPPPQRCSSHNRKRSHDSNDDRHQGRDRRRRL